MGTPLPTSATSAVRSAAARHLSARTPIALLEQFRTTGSQDAFEEIVRRYAAMVFHTCQQVARNRHDAEDATQAVFLTLAVHLKAGKEIRALGPWLQQVAHRISLDLRKSKKRREARERRRGVMDGRRHASEVGALSQAPIVSIDVQERREAISQELDKLPPRYRLPLILHYFGGLSREEIARELSLKPGTLGVRLHRAREMLGSLLAKRDIVLTGAALAAGITCAVQRTVSESLITATSHAAAQIAAGNSVAPGVMSVHVVALARSAVHAMALARVKAVAAFVVLAGTAVAAGADAVSRALPGELRLRVPLEIKDVFPRRILPRWDNPFTSPQVRNTQTPEDSAIAAAPSPSLGPTLARQQSHPQLPPFSSVPSLPKLFEIPIFESRRAQYPAPLPFTFSQCGASAAPITITTPPPHPGRFEFPSIGGGLAAAPLRTSRSDAVQINHPIRSNSPPAARPNDPSVHIPNQPTPHPPQDRNNPIAIGENPPSTPPPVSPQPDVHLYLSPASSAVVASAAVTHLDSIRAPNGFRLSFSDSEASNSFSTLMIVRTAGHDSAPSAPHSGTHTGPWYYSQHPAPVYSRAAIDGQTILKAEGVLRGHGTLGNARSYDHGGTLIADGNGTDRMLDLTGINTIRSTHENAIDNHNGWYAVNHGRLSLPAINVTAGAHSYTWGEEPTDPVLDLVNAVRITFKNARADGTLRINLLAPDRDDLPELPVSEADSIVGLWSFDAGALAYDAADVTIRYDARWTLGLTPAQESGLRLWIYDDQWRLVDHATVDSLNNVISATIDPLTYAALTIDDMGISVRMTLLPGDAPPALTTTVPEPSGFVTLGIMSAALLARRRRRW